MHTDSFSTLFDLIHSMNKGEKRYFKLYARSRAPHVRNMNYIRLFDAIEKQREHNEEKIKSLNIVKKDHLRMLKNYLYHLILESMRDHRSKGKHTYNIIKNTFADALILQEKGLKNQEIKFLERAKELSGKHEQWGILLDILLMESKYSPQQSDSKIWKKLSAEMHTLFEKTINLMEYDRFRFYINAIMRSSGTVTVIRHSGQNRMLKKLTNLELIKNGDKAISVSAKISYYWNLSFLYLLRNDYKNCHTVYADLIRFIESNISLVRSPDNILIGAMTNFFNIQILLHRYKEAFETQRKQYALIRKKPKVESKIWRNFYVDETAYYILTGEFKKGILLRKEIEKRVPSLNDPDKSIAPDLTFSDAALYLNMACLYFGNEDYRSALRWTNRIMQQPKTSVEEDLQSFIKIFIILIHFELNTPDILDYLIVSAYRYLRRKERMYKYEESVLRFFRRISKITPTKEFILREFEKFKNELIQITKDPEEKKALFYFDLIAWLESKIANRPFAEVVRQRADMPAGS